MQGKKTRLGDLQIRLAQMQVTEAKTGYLSESLHCCSEGSQSVLHDVRRKEQPSGTLRDNAWLGAGGITRVNDLGPLPYSNVFTSPCVILHLLQIP
jgi:hypothetical protein